MNKEAKMFKEIEEIKKEISWSSYTEKERRLVDRTIGFTVAIMYRKKKKKIKNKIGF